MLVTGRVDGRYLLLPGTLPPLLHLLAVQFIMLAWWTLRLAPSLVSLGLVGTVATLATLAILLALPLVAAWLLAWALVRAPLVLVISVIPRRLLGALVTLLLSALWGRRSILGPLIGGWASPSASALACSLR